MTQQSEPRSNHPHAPRSFEIFVQQGFCELEVAATTHTLRIANQVVGTDLFSWGFVSDTPGFVNGSGGQILRAVPAVPDHGLSDYMIVVGGARILAEKWLPRIRAVSRQGGIVTLFSAAATAYIQSARPKVDPVTTHWRDIARLRETECLVNMSTRLSERTGNIITAAGSASTSEIVIGLISDMLSGVEIAEVANHLILPSIRSNRADQPNSISDLNAVFGKDLNRAIKIMERTVEDPLAISDLTQQLGISSRQLERSFKAVLDTSPARFYKQLRVKRARTLVEETRLSLLDIALASGFTSTGSLARAFRDEYGLSPSQIRARKTVSFTS